MLMCGDRAAGTKALKKHDPGTESLSDIEMVYLSAPGTRHHAIYEAMQDVHFCYKTNTKVSSWVLE